MTRYRDACPLIYVAQGFYTVVRAFLLNVEGEPAMERGFF